MKKATEDSTMIVLGAGASIGANRYPTNDWCILRMPSAQHFFYDLFNLKKINTNPKRCVNSLGMLYEGVKELLERGYGLKNTHDYAKDMKDINVEDFFTFLNIGKMMFDKKDSYYRVFSEGKSNLEDFIVMILSFISEGQHCKHLYRIFSKLRPQDNIISFNWDTIADNTLELVKSKQYENYVKIIQTRKININEYIKPGLFLKLHGSLNWIICQNRSCKDFGKIILPISGSTKKTHRLFHQGFYKCKSCKRRTKRFIVPPTLNKDIYRNSFLRNLWLIARQKFRLTKKFIFIGYSFPPADFYSEWLFRQIYFLDNGNPEIIVVNPEMYKKGSLIKKRYEKIFKNYNITKYRDLAEYVKKTTV